MARYCPNCGAIVPENSLNCPQCYTEVPRGEEVNERDHMNHQRSREEYRDQLGKRRKSHTLSMILAVFPAFFGFLGLAQIYQDRRDSKGWVFLIFGILLFAAITGMIFIIGATALIASIFLAIPLVLAILLYIGAALVCIADAYSGSYRRFGLRF